jgi:hypothetical protein
MMEPGTAKLAHKLDNDAALAEKLVNAGFDTPGKIERATNRELRETADLSPAELKQVRAVFPKAD